MRDVMSEAVVRRRRFTVDEYHRMAEAGILHEDEPVELIEGELIQMAAVGSRHMACVNDVTRLLIIGLGDRAIVSIQNPVRLSSGSEPEPDVAILRPRPDRYRTALPRPEDVLLVIEVSDTTLRYDRDVKLPLYAAAGIPEAWIVDLEGCRILVYRAPAGAAYDDTTTIEQGTVSPAAFPEIVISVEELLG